ncbi:MAG: DUF3418 domain-containing protein, partial [Actinobacteria bacterium]|nr:DUF3418 domain-containing protein [Actinomycetota bacterium]NIU66985.1 DUF3418 domain-containing protein [Actinomycetota bacterium]NIW28783.1 DUF3418 domain-containing protein [Actinomycetota bacterium]NIX24011.1 DUF3418 domain-containing protein [Actinomycetota bacterium]
MRLDALPDHLRPTFRIVGHDGEPVAEGRDLAALKSELVDAARATLDATSHEIERTGLTEWSIGELPPVVHVGGRTPAYPALVDEGDSVAVRLLANRDEQAHAMWAGTVRLLLTSLPSPQRLVAPLLDREAKLTLRSGPHASSEEWVEDCLA